MATEREARAVGAGDSITVNSIAYKLRPINIRSLCEMEREALRQYKRSYLQTYQDNMDLLSIGEAAMGKKIAEVASWDVTHLPQKKVFSARHLPATPALLAWAESQYGGFDADMDDDAKARISRIVVADALDSGDVTPEEVKAMCGAYPRQGRVRWDQWWATNSHAGRLRFILTSLSLDQPTMTDKDLAVWPPSKIIEAISIVEDLTVASAGNT